MAAASCIVYRTACVEYSTIVGDVGRYPLLTKKKAAPAGDIDSVVQASSLPA
jgi:hypothetical protein